MLESHSYYSFLRAASSPEDLVARASDLGLEWLSLTDWNGLYGASSFYRACQEALIHPVVGAEVAVGEGSVVLLCEDMRGYTNLSRLITAMHKGREKGEGLATYAMLEEHREGLFCLAEGDFERLGEVYGERLYGSLSLRFEEGDLHRCREIVASGLPCVIGGGVRYARREEARLYDVLTCIRHGVTISCSHRVRAGNSLRFLRGREEVRHLYREFEGVFERTEELAERCRVDLDFSAYRFPHVEGTREKLRKLCQARCPEGYREKMEEELRLIEKLDLSGYFLIVWDIIEYAKGLGVPAQGRGSADNSLVAFLLGITPVDPVKHELFLGRFIHEGMHAVPDIDLDFAAARESGLPDRESVIQYVYDKYGADHVAMVCTFVTFKRKMAVREVTKVMEGEAPEELVEGLIGIPRHQGIHVGGMLIASRPISELVPLEPARMEGRVVCQWDKDMVEDAGLIKVDILSLGMLAVLRDVGVETSRLTFDDPKVYEMMGRADTVGVFQIESRAQMQSLPRTRPRNLPELGIQVAIIRPGPLQGNMVAPYIRRRQGTEGVSYPHPCLEPVLKETLGVILFQEQVLQVAEAMAGFTQSQAAQLRKAMSRKRSHEAMGELEEAFVRGARERGVSEEVARHTFELLRGFALYGFCKSHALSFAVITYKSAWLKFYHPAEFLAAILNNQPMGFYSSEVFIQDAKRHGVEILPVDINASRTRSAAREKSVRLGLQMVKGVAFENAALIESEQPFESVEDFIRRTGLNPEFLIQAGAFDSLTEVRREALWKGWAPLEPHAMPELPFQSDWEKLIDEYRTLSLSPKWHPLSFLRQSLSERGFVDSKRLERAPDGAFLDLAGLLVCRQMPPTAKGFVFLTLEDELGLMNIVISPPVYERFGEMVKASPFLGVRGKKEERDGVVNLKASAIQVLSPRSGG